MLQTLLINGAHNQWFAIRNGRIWHKGICTDLLKQMQRFLSPESKIIDLKGHFLHPAFTDFHLHLLSIGRMSDRLNLTGMKSLCAVRESVRARVALAEPGEWILGRGWDQNLWASASMPTALDLDDIAPNNPVFLIRVDGHAAWVNSYALKLAGVGVTDAALSIDGGEIIAGVLIDNAIALVEKVLPVESKNDRRRYLEKALQECSRMGLSQVVEMQISLEDLDLFCNFFNSQKKLRVSAMIDGHGSLAYEMLQQKDPSYWAEFIRRYHSPFFKIEGMKFYADGALGSRGALLKAAYNDYPSSRGLEVLPKTEMYRLFSQATRAGLQLSVHALGDQAVSNVLDVCEELKSKALLQPRLRLEHLEVLDPKDIPRISALGAVASVQGVHLIDDMDWLAERLGPQRMQERVCLWKSLLQAGVLLVNGTDAPIADLSPLKNFKSLITRAGFKMEEALSREEALVAMTDNAVSAALNVGMQADLLLLSKDLLHCTIEEILETTIEMNMVSGEVTFARSTSTSTSTST